MKSIWHKFVRERQPSTKSSFHIVRLDMEQLMIVRTILLLVFIYSHVHAAENGDELGKASSLFTRPVELLSEDPRFKW